MDCWLDCQVEPGLRGCCVGGCVGHVLHGGCDGGVGRWEIVGRYVILEGRGRLVILGGRMLGVRFHRLNHLPLLTQRRIHVLRRTH